MVDDQADLGYRPAHGVAFTPPPRQYHARILDQINSIVPTLRDGNRNALVFIPTSEGVNAALIVQGDISKPLDWSVKAWIGKTWGEPTQAGAVISLEWP